jgi:hypothetical protein
VVAEKIGTENSKARTSIMTLLVVKSVSLFPTNDSSGSLNSSLSYFSIFFNFYSEYANDFLLFY